MGHEKTGGLYDDLVRKAFERLAANYDGPPEDIEKLRRMQFPEEGVNPQVIHEEEKRPSVLSNPLAAVWTDLIEQYREGNRDNLTVPAELQPSYARLERAFAAADVIMATVPSGIERVVLFGSAARGQARVDSDIDIAVVYTPGFDIYNSSAEGPTARIRHNLVEHGFQIGTGGEHMPFNIQFHAAHFYSGNLPPHMQPANFAAIREIKGEGVTLRQAKPSK